MGKGVEIRANSLRITFTWKGKQERRTVITNGNPLSPTPTNIRYAERLAAEIREKIRLGIFSLAEYFPADGESHLSLDAQVDKWIKSRRITDSTKASYVAAKGFWAEHLPGATLHVLHSEILTVIASRPDLSGKTLTNYLSVLRESFNLAVRDGLVKESPVAGIEGPKWQKEPPDPFDAEEREAIIALAEKRHPGHVSNMVEFWFWTGMRTSEVLGLSWQDVDLKRKSATIKGGLVRGKMTEKTKTSTARTVILNSRAWSAIQRQQALTRIANGLVFLDPRTGEPWPKEQPFRQNFWIHLLKGAGIRYRRAYQMRHTYATAMLMAGMTPAFCARQLGHSVEIFLRTYSRWIDGQRDDLEMARLESSFGDKSGIKSGIEGV